jgi:hypothetical protein
VADVPAIAVSRASAPRERRPALRTAQLRFGATLLHGSIMRAPRGRLPSFSCNPIPSI